jgi:hypothetical protein
MVVAWPCGGSFKMGGVVSSRIGQVVAGAMR